MNSPGEGVLGIEDIGSRPDISSVGMGVLPPFPLPFLLLLPLSSVEDLEVVGDDSRPESVVVAVVVVAFVLVVGPTLAVASSFPPANGLGNSSASSPLPYSWLLECQTTRFFAFRFGGLAVLVLELSIVGSGAMVGNEES